MKKWTKKFLANKHIPVDRCSPTEGNARRAEKNLDLPAVLWHELSQAWPTSYMNVRCIKNPFLSSALKSAFMAGVAVGWVEKYRKIK